MLNSITWILYLISYTVTPNFLLIFFFNFDKLIVFIIFISLYLYYFTH